MGELQEHIERIELMSKGDPTWDLSDNDYTALKAVLENMDSQKALIGEFIKITIAAINACSNGKTYETMPRCGCPTTLKLENRHRDCLLVPIICALKKSPNAVATAKASS